MPARARAICRNVTEHIAALNDTDLRTLVGRLCEAELVHLGHSPALVTYGGNQDSSDGGVDVRVQLSIGLSVEGFVPRTQTVFQVKKPDLEPAKIKKEMAPGGVIRPVIKELVEQNGAYIIATGATLTDSQLQSRLRAMAEVVKLHCPGHLLRLDVYDRTRIASWVRSHPGLLPWVRQRCGFPLHGWSSYHDWPTGSNDYLLDTSCRLKSPDGASLTVEEGINNLRVGLSRPQQVFRLVGLSGVGKTRLARALFDQLIGHDPLPAQQMVYADLADSPDPIPQHLLSTLTASQQSAVVIVDNCGPELHRRLASLVTGAGSTVSLLTIEYDIRDDHPESTKVFELEAASEELVERLIASLRPDLSSVDRRRLASISGGNARVALCLADALGQRQSSAELSDDQLFRRLFWQRHQVDQRLERAAQVLALVYSFQGESTAQASELSTLAQLAEMSATELYGYGADLFRRQLIQRRSDWRALLPHPIANRLAAQALESFPLHCIEQALIGPRPGRLAVSFCHRLSFLHHCDPARELVEKWLQPGGLLGAYPLGEEALRSMFFYVAPVAPAAWLSVLERSPDSALFNMSRVVSTVVCMAYDPRLFDRAIQFLVRLSLSGSAQRNQQSHHSFGSLFQLYCSGTQAKPEQRLNCIASLLNSDEPRHHNLACDLLGAYLQATHFVGSQSCSFGQHARDDGYQPRTWAEVKGWFEAGLQLIAAFANRTDSPAYGVREVLANSFRGLWLRGGCHDELERVCRSMRAHQFWPEILPSIDRTMFYDSESMPDSFRLRLEQLRLDLAPTTLVERAWDVLSNQEHRWDPETRSNTDESDVGAEVAEAPEVLQVLLPRLINIHGGRRFASGLASRLDDPSATWSALLQAYAEAPPSRRGPEALAGFLEGAEARHPSFVQAALDEALTSDLIAPVFVQLQTAVQPSADGIRRIRRAVQLNLAQPQPFRLVQWWKAGSRVVADRHIAFLALQLSTKGEEGFRVAVEMLAWRLKRRVERKAPIRSCLRLAGRQILRHFTASQQTDIHDYNLGVVARHCLVGPRCARSARRLVRRLRVSGRLSLYDFPTLLEGLVASQPRAVLEELLDGPDQEFSWIVIGLNSGARLKPSPLNEIDPGLLISWAAEKPKHRFQRLARVLELFERPSETEPYRWKAIALQLLARCDAPVDILTAYAEQISPRFRDGSRAQVMEDRAGLFETLAAAVDPTIRPRVAEARARFLREIEEEREQERRSQAEQYERFE